MYLRCICFLCFGLIRRSLSEDYGCRSRSNGSSFELFFWHVCVRMVFEEHAGKEAFRNWLLMLVEIIDGLDGSSISAKYEGLKQYILIIEKGQPICSDHWKLLGNPSYRCTWEIFPTFCSQAKSRRDGKMLFGKRVAVSVENEFYRFCQKASFLLHSVLYSQPFTPASLRNRISAEILRLHRTFQWNRVSSDVYRRLCKFLGSNFLVPLFLKRD